MVLHNNKWDKRAKYNYLKKHGLLKNQQNQEQAKEVKQKYTKNKQDESYSSEDEETIQKDDITLNEPSSEDTYKDGIMLTKNKPEVESTGIQISLLDDKVDDDLNKKIEDMQMSDSSDDEEFVKYSNLTKNINHSYDLKRPIKDVNLATAINDIKTKKKQLQDLDFATLAKLDIDNIDGTYEDKSVAKNNVKLLSEKETDDLHEMIKKAEKQKLFRTIKMKMDSKNGPMRIRAEGDTQSKKGIDEFLGIESKISTYDIKNDDDILNDLINSDARNPIIKTNGVNFEDKNSKRPVKNLRSVADDNKILDDLLNL